MMRQQTEKYDVAFYAPWIGPLLVNQKGKSTGGAETQVFLLARALAARGLRVCLLAFDMPGETIPAAVDGVDIRVRPPYKSRQRLIGKLREAWNIASALGSVRAATVITRAAGPHVGLVGLFSKLRGRRFVYASASPIDYDVARVAPKRRDQLLLRLGYRLADEIVVQTEEQRTSCEERIGRTPSLIPSITEAAEPARAARETFLWIGRLVSYKQPLVFVELARSLPDIMFTMVAAEVPFAPGAAELVAAIRAAATELPNLIVLEPLPRAELMEHVDRSIAVVSTSTFEGMPNVFLEAWTRAIPAVAYAYDPDSVVERNGLGAFAHGDFDELVRICRELADAPAIAAELGRAARRYVQAVHGADAVSLRWRAVVAPHLAPGSRVAVEVD